METAMRGFDLASEQEKVTLAGTLVDRVQAKYESGDLDAATTRRYCEQLKSYYR